MWSLDPNAWLIWLGWQSLLAAAFGLPVWVLSRLLQHRRPRLMAGLWILVLCRFIVPHSWGTWSWSQPEWIVPMVEPVHSESSWTLAPSPATPEPTRNLPAIRWNSLLLATWICGVGGFLIRWIRDRGQFDRLIREARALPPKLEAEARLLGLPLGIRRDVQLLHHPDIRGGFTKGWWNPSIVIGSDLLHRDRDRSSVLAHEFVHVARFDDLWVTLESWVRSLFFFHPLAWIASKEALDRREILCDRRAVRLLRISPRGYGSTLLRFLDHPARIPVRFFNPRQKRSLAMRLRALIDPQGDSRFTSMALMAAALMGFASISPADLEAPIAFQDPPPAENAVLINPLPSGRVTSSFGFRPDPFRSDSKTHRGIDLSAPLDTPIVAPAKGRVLAVHDDLGLEHPAGITILLDHGNGLHTYYAHLNAVEVGEGQDVQSGQTIGLVGSTGLSTGPHLHFEVRENEEPVDPALHIPDWDRR